MSSSNGGKRKRGRPVILTPEQRLERQRERWRIEKACNRKAAQDAAWLLDNPSGYFVQLWVPRLVKELVRVGYLDKAGKDIAPRVDAAADKVLKDYCRGPSYGFRESGVVKAGAVRVRMTQELASKLADDEYAERFPPIAFAWRKNGSGISGDGTWRREPAGRVSSASRSFSKCRLGER
jgi:hypothetical protein